MKGGSAKVLLLVDADPAGVELLTQALEHDGRGHTLRAVDSLKNAEGYVSGETFWADRTKHPLPDIVLVDLSLAAAFPATLQRKLGQGIPLLLLARAADPRLPRLTPDRYVEKPATLGAAVVLIRSLLA